MDINTVAIFGIVASLLLLLVRRERPEMALVLALAVGLCLFTMAIPKIKEAVSMLEDLSRDTGLEPFYFGIVLKVLAIAYISDFASSISRDAGEEMVAGRVELLGRLLILTASFPIIKAVITLIQSLLS